MMNLFAGQTESNDHDQRGIPHLSRHLERQNLRDESVSAGERAPGDGRAGRRLVRLPEARHGRRAAGQLERGRGRATTNSTAGRCSSASTRISATTGACRRASSAVRRTATRRFTTRSASTANSSRSMPSRSTTTAEISTRDGIVDVVAEADRGTGTIICNVQRYNPTPAQLQASVAGVRCPQPIGDTRLGGPDGPRADSGPRRSRRDSELRADERASARAT